MSANVEMKAGNTEFLTIKEFADRLTVGRTTVYEWIKKGHLVAGRHFIRYGRVIRFLWGPDLIQKLCEDSKASNDPTPVYPNALPKLRANRGRTAINLNY